MLRNLLRQALAFPRSERQTVPRSANHALEELRAEFEKRSQSEPKTRLPSHLPPAEFTTKIHAPKSPFLPLSIDNKTRRVAALAWKDVTERRNAQILITSLSAITLLSGIEGVAIINSSSLPLLEPQYLTLLLKYSITNVIPSCVWTTNEMSTVALSSSLDPAIISALTGSTLIKTTTLRSFRYIVATTTLISQLLRFFSVSVRASDAFKDNIRDGKERPFDNVNERVIRLAGRKSDVTVVSLDKYQDHIFPVFEDPSAVRYTVAEYSDNYSKPTFWTVDRRSYGHKRAFQKLNIDDSWLVDCTSAGRRILILEADLVNEEDSLSLNPISRDLTIDNASGAFREIVSRASECMTTKNYRILRVILGDSTEMFASGGGHTRTLRDRVLGSKEADLIVDSRAPVLLAVLQWYDQKHPPSVDPRRLLFFTDSKEYFTHLREILRPFNIEVVDGFIATTSASASTSTSSSASTSSTSTSTPTPTPTSASATESEAPTLPTLGLVHYTTTSLTTNTALGLTKQGLLKNFKSVLVLVDKPIGIQLIESEGEENLSVLCSALTHDLLLHNVRMWSRMGFSPASIQEELDFQFAKVLEAEAIVSNDHRQEQEGGLENEKNTANNGSNNVK
ncbi:hypothetical protein TrVE_jg10103 [Triparma verrucosa]|uniref:Uncharacterized protein n=1 Tax=Triparma verrucosa TaxID=1606542 RepID=A0A9W7F9J7_9STRA|nr:hypothetical protein TrVE_jg10103 [Triparma verrucosa]